MVTLTFREKVVDGRTALRKWMREVRAMGMGEWPWAWVREYQKRGAVHYHWLWPRKELEKAGMMEQKYMRKVWRGGAERSVVGGPLEARVLHAWSKAVGDESEAFARFQAGGIVELLEDQTSAGRYFGSYLTKKEQKTLPAGAEGCGRWWAMARSAKPLPGHEAWLTAWPYDIPLSVIFDKRKLDCMITGERPSIIMPTRQRK